MFAEAAISRRDYSCSRLARHPADAAGTHVGVLYSIRPNFQERFPQRKDACYAQSHTDAAILRETTGTMCNDENHHDGSVKHVPVCHDGSLQFLSAPDYHLSPSPIGGYDHRHLQGPPNHDYNTNGTPAARLRSQPDENDKLTVERLCIKGVRLGDGIARRFVFMDTAKSLSVHNRKEGCSGRSFPSVMIKKENTIRKLRPEEMGRNRCSSHHETKSRLFQMDAAPWI